MWLPQNTREWGMEMNASGTLTCPRCGTETPWPTRCDCEPLSDGRSSDKEQRAFIATMAREYGPEAGEAVAAFLSTRSAGGETIAPCVKCGKTPPFPGGTRCQDLECPLVNWAVGPTLTQRLRALYLCTENVADAETLKEAIERISTQSATAIQLREANPQRRDDVSHPRLQGQRGCSFCGRGKRRLGRRGFEQDGRAERC
jgi:hypothetical protein